MTNAYIEGGGIAAASCAFLLRRAGIEVGVRPVDRPPLPAILLGDAAQHLICDLFEAPGLFGGFPRIRTRIVAWGADSTPAVLPHSAVIVSERQLLDCFGAPSLPVISEGAAAWTISTSGRPECRQFGSRSASAAEVRLRDGAEPEACWIESVESGWLFLITTAAGCGWLLAVGDTPSEILSASRLISAQLAHVGDWTGRFPAAPRILTPLSGRGWLACGSAAMGFDPLCGDGTAHSVREAILASAIIQAAEAGEDSDSLLAHYRARLTAAFQRHLGVCLNYYCTGGAGPWWTSEVAAIREGMRWCYQELRDAGEFRYRLEGFRLRPRHCRSTTG